LTALILYRYSPSNPGCVYITMLYSYEDAERLCSQTLSKDPNSICRITVLTEQNMIAAIQRENDNAWRQGKAPEGVII